MDAIPAINLDDYAQIADPVECAKRITQLARSRGNLPAPLAHLRVRRLLEARYQDGRCPNWLSRKVGLGLSGIYRLTSSPVQPEGVTP